MCCDEETLIPVIVELLRKAGKLGLTKTQLIKLVFFTDLEACKEGIGPVTSCNYHTDQYGVVDYSIWDTTIKMVDSGCVEHTYDEDFSGYTRHNIVLVSDEYDDTPQELVDLISQVWAIYGTRTASQLGAITKSLVSMDDEWESGVQVDPRDIAYEESDRFNEHCDHVKDNYPEGHTEVRPIEELLERNKK